MKKYVLTGGPSVGKTTVIEILASRGYTVVPEAARQIIQEERQKGSDILPSKNLKRFQECVAERQLLDEEKATGDIVFLDRSLIDGYAYCVLGNVSVPAIVSENGRGRYDTIFFLESLGAYIEDGIRSRTLEDATKIHLKIKEVYSEFGYHPISVPVLPPEERVDFILKKIFLL
jgi:predicted ATPase